MTDLDPERFLSAAWLAQMDAANRRALFSTLREGRAPAGSCLLAEGEPNSRITFVIEGTVVLLRSYPGRDDEVIATLVAPAPFGETSFFRGKPSIVTVRAQTPVRFLTLDRPAYEAFRASNPVAAEQFALATVRILAERFDLIDRRVSEFLHEQHDNGHKASEWADFRARLFSDQ